MAELKSVPSVRERTPSPYDLEPSARGLDLSSVVLASLEEPLPSSDARVTREGHHVSLIVGEGCLPFVTAVAERLAKLDISAEVLYVASLGYIDGHGVRASLVKTGNAAIFEFPQNPNYDLYLRDTLSQEMADELENVPVVVRGTSVEECVSAIRTMLSRD